jgi:acyl carrier protein
MNGIEPRLVRCFQAVFPDLPASRVTGASVETVSGWDSIAMVNLLNLVSEEFGIEVEWEHVAEMTSFAALRQMIADRTAIS